MLLGKVGYMNVKTADLKNNLSRYLRDMRRTGETITVCDRDTPVAVLSPLPTEEGEVWKRECAARAGRLAQFGLGLKTPSKRPAKPTLRPPLPAGDGRTNLRSIESTRRKDY